MRKALATAANYALGPDQLIQALKGLVLASQPAMVWGQPGLGKSDCAKKVAADLNMTYIDVRALLLDPVGDYNQSLTGRREST